MTAGYSGKILRLNLTKKTTGIIDTAQYEEWGGGHGIGSAIFWDLCQDKTIDGFDPRNIITVMTSPLSGTLAPGVSGRCEVQGIGVQQYPVGWYTRSNFGGRFCGMLKAAGWDGVLIEGKADAPVWVSIADDRVTFEDARRLWGLDTWETQLAIWKDLTGEAKFGEWSSLDSRQTTQKPAVLCIGPAGEHLSRSGCLIHETGHGAGQGGFGGIWGAKNLKAISVLGTGGIMITDPKALMDARLRFDRNFPYNNEGQSGLSGCQGCPKLCMNRNLKDGNGSMCIELGWYGDSFGEIKVPPEVSKKACDLSQKYGINICDLAIYANRFPIHPYLVTLHEMGVLGPGKAIDSAPLPWDKLGSMEFAEALLKAIAYREGIGDALAEGPVRAAIKWGRLEEDLASGILKSPQWGYSYHSSIPSVEWSFGSILGDRDITEHDFEFHPAKIIIDGRDLRIKIPAGIALYPKELSTEQLVKLLAGKTIPYTGDPLMFNYAWQGADGSNMAEALNNGIYSRHKARFVAWHRHYTRFWKQSIQYCDWMYASFTSDLKPHHSGFTPEAEPQFLNAVTGKNLSFADGMETGRRIWNLDRAIWILQGRHRDMEKLSDFLFKPGAAFPGRQFPVYKDGKWQMIPLDGMFLDRAGVETFKTRFYEFEGWDTSSGWPSRDTLQDLGLKKVTEALQKAGRLGASGTYSEAH